MILKMASGLNNRLFSYCECFETMHVRVKQCLTTCMESIVASCIMVQSFRRPRTHN